MEKKTLQEYGFTDEQLDQADEQVSMVEFGTLHNHEGKQFWFYLNIKPSLYLDYKQAFVQGSSIDIKSYGDVLAYGWGNTPPDNVIQTMQDEHNCSPNFEGNIQEAFSNVAKK